MPPVDPSSFLTAGPLGILAAATFFVWQGVRQWTQGKAIDVDTARAAALAERARAEDVAAELALERGQRIQLERAHTRTVEDYVLAERKYRHALAQAGVNPEGVIPSASTASASKEPPT